MIQVMSRHPAPRGNSQSDPHANRRWILSRLARALAMALLVGAAAGGLWSFAQDSTARMRVVQGLVQDSANKPLANAVVYLRNQKTMEVETYITGKDGRYRFGELSSDNDMQVWAAFHGNKSKTRAISSFDTKPQFNFDFKIDTSK